MRNRLVYLLAVTMLLGACRSHKVKDGGEDTFAADSLAGKTENVTWQSGDVATTTARTTMTYNGRRATLDAHVRLKRDDVIQVQFSYSMIITIQVGSMELTRDEFLFIDRINKQYTRAPYMEADEFLKRDINFRNVQAMFWGDADGMLPKELLLALPVSGKTLKAHFVFDEWSREGEWQTRTVFNEGRFAKVTLEELVETLINM